MAQCPNNVLLSDQGGEIARSPLARENLIAHAPNPKEKWKWRALPPALAVNGCGCFLPDLTRLTTLQCGETRRCE